MKLTLKHTNNGAQDNQRNIEQIVWIGIQKLFRITKIIDPIECKNLIRYLNGTSSPELNIYDYPTILTFFDDVSFQRRLEQRQPPFTVKNKIHLQSGIITYDVNDKNWIQNASNNYYSSCKSKGQQQLLLKSWKLTISEIEITYDDKENKMIYDGHTLPCLHTDGYCKPTTITPYTLVWFIEEFCLIFRLQELLDA